MATGVGSVTDRFKAWREHGCRFGFLDGGYRVAMTHTGSSDTETVRLDGCAIDFDSEVLRPRPWTVAQSIWGSKLATLLPPGPILELYAGVGHIGLIAARRSGRDLVQVESDGHACSHAAANAERAGLSESVEIRQDDAETALAPHEQFPLVIADPPYLPTQDVDGFPEDPLTAVDGGADGLDKIRGCLNVLTGCLAIGGSALLQVRGPSQAAEVARELPAKLRRVKARHYGPTRSIVQLQHREPGAPV